MPTTGTIHTICARHRRTALVGPGTLLSELECVDCIAEQDADTWRPCCSQMNTTCCGHDDDAHGAFFVEILSPGFCSADRTFDEVPF